MKRQVSCDLPLFFEHPQRKRGEEKLPYRRWFRHRQKCSLVFWSWFRESLDVITFLSFLLALYWFKRPAQEN